MRDIPTASVQLPRLTVRSEDIDASQAYDQVLQRLNLQEGGLFQCNLSSDIYRRKALAFFDPAITLEYLRDGLKITAYDEIGMQLYLSLFKSTLEATKTIERAPERLQYLLNAVLHPKGLETQQDGYLLGLYGAFGFDLALASHGVHPMKPRRAEKRDAVLYFPSTFIEFDLDREAARRVRFSLVDTTADHPTRSETFFHAFASTYQGEMAFGGKGFEPQVDHASAIAKVKEHIGAGDCFEVVMSKRFSQPMAELPADLYRRICQKRSAPYSAFLNLGSDESLLTTSPEMLVRCSAGLVEARPIAGSIERGESSVEDETNIRWLLNSDKARAELMMCCDVARNDLAKVCEPGSVVLRANRQIEVYSNVIHTVDYITGRLRAGQTAVDALFAHMWSVALTGAPKKRALELIEQYEPVPRGWYGGAFGYIRLNGDVDTGIPICMMQIEGAQCHVQAGSSITWDSEPTAEVREAENKVSFFADDSTLDTRSPSVPLRGTVLVVDFDDSFTHLTVDLLIRASVNVRMVNHRHAQAALAASDIDAVLFSAGPGHPSDYPFSSYLDACIDRGVPVFGICLGFQGIAEYFGGRAQRLASPVHGKHSDLQLIGASDLYAGLGSTIRVGRYHSLGVSPNDLPEELRITSFAACGTVMSFEHRQLPIYGVQFHPESIMSAGNNVGAMIVEKFVEVALAQRRGMK